MWHFILGRFVRFVYSLPTSASLEFGFIETSWSHVPVSFPPPASSRSLQRIRSVPQAIPGGNKTQMVHTCFQFEQDR